MRNRKDSNRNQRGSNRQSDRQATGAVGIGESQITVGLVDEDGCVLKQAICIFTAMPLYVDPCREIPATLMQLALDAHVEISHITITDRRLKTLTRQLFDEFHVPVTREDDAGSAAAPENESGETYLMVRNENNIWEFTPESLTTEGRR